MTSTSTAALPDSGWPTSSVDIAQRLIRFDTVNPPGDEAACIQWVAELLRSAGFQTRILAADRRRPNLVARLAGRGLEPPLLLHAHVDVVPSEGQSWSRPPFGAEIINGELWGRGAVDMKGQLAMMLAAMMRMRARDETPAGDIIIAVMPDEETGSVVGARFLTQQHPELFSGVRYAIGEEGGAELGLGRFVRLHPIVVAEKRTCWTRATLRGPGGHASRVLGADGAIAKLNRLLTAVSSGGMGAQMTPFVDRMLQELAAALPPEPATSIAAFRAQPEDPTALAGLDESTARYLRSIVQHTISVTVLRGGTGTNVHPSEITVELDARLLPGPFSTSDFLEQVRVRIGAEADLDVFVEGEIVTPAPLDEFYDRLVGVLRWHDPAGVPLPTVTTASTDARLFSQLGIRCFGWLPLLHAPDVTYRDRLHCADERIAVSALEFGADCYHTLLSGAPGGQRS